MASYLVETDDGPALFDVGPTTTLPALERGLAAEGLTIGDLRHLLISHIHLDHAGAAGVLVRRNPKLHVHVSAVGAPHLIAPERLEASARRLFGDDFDRLWGELAPVPAENVEVTTEEVVGLSCFDTPGHAGHHVCFLDREGTLYAGDVAGVRILPQAPVMPPTPPPEIDIAAWLTSIEELERREPRRIALIHFGVVDDPTPHLVELRERLIRWGEVARAEPDDFDFAAFAVDDLGDVGDDLPAYTHVTTFPQAYQGLRRWATRLAV